MTTQSIFRLKKIVLVVGLLASGTAIASDFWLVNAQSDTKLLRITSGLSLTASQIPTNFSFSYEPTSPVGEKVIQLRGPVSFSRKEKVAPYALFGDSAGDYYSSPNNVKLLPGKYEISVEGQKIAFSVKGETVTTTPVVAKPATRNEAARFLAQATFGPVEADIDRLMAIGYLPWIDEQFKAPRVETHRAFYERVTADDDPNKKPAVKSVFGSVWKQALTGSDQLRQRMAYALSQILVISLNNNTINDDPRAVAAWMDMLSNNSFGNYRQLLDDVARNPQMGVYLTHIKNQKADPATGRFPDQNFAREIMQLFTLGVVQLNMDGSIRRGSNGAPLETYTSDDVAGLANVFTGWSVDCPGYPSDNCFNKYTTGPGNQGESYSDKMIRPMRAYPKFHSTDPKNFLGITISGQTTAEESLRLALDHLFKHPNVAPFIGRQLIQHFVTSNPSPSYVSSVAQTFANNGKGVRGDLAATIKAILMHPEARTQSFVSGKVREPVLRLSALLRAFSYQSNTGEYHIGNTSDPSYQLSQTPLDAPSVFNFYRPGYVAPGTKSAELNKVAPVLQITSELTHAAYINFMTSGISNGFSDINYTTSTGQKRRDMQSKFVPEMALASDAAALVDHVLTRLNYGNASSALRTQIINAVNTITVPTGGDTTKIDQAKRNRVNAAILLTVSSPDFIVIK